MLGISALLSNQTINVIGLIFFLWADLEKSSPPPFIWLDGNLDFLISISLQLYVVHLRYFNLWILLDQIIYKDEISKVYTIRLQRNSDFKIFIYGQEDSIIANILKKILKKLSFPWHSGPYTILCKALRNTLKCHAHSVC